MTCGRLLALMKRFRGCRHDWHITGPTGTGWFIGRCSRCGSVELFS